MSAFRRSITDFSYSTNPKKQLLITLSELRPQSVHEETFEQPTPQHDTIAKRMSRIMNKQEDQKAISDLLQFTKVDEKSEEARVKVRKRDRLKTESEFQLYQRSLHYSRERNLKKAFDEQFKVKKEPQRLKEEVLTLAEMLAKKEGQNLIDSNWNTRNNNIILESLNNPQMREKTLQKALLFEIYYDYRKSEIEEAMNKTNIQSTSFGKNHFSRRKNDVAKIKSRQLKNRQNSDPVAPGMLLGPTDVPKIYKSINPRHLRIKTEGSYTEEQFRRARYVQTKTSLQYFQKAFNAVSEDNENKRKDNAELINMLVQINLQETLDESEHKFESRIFKRLYLHYSNHIDDDPFKLFTYVPLASLEKLCHTFLPQIDLAIVQDMHKSMEPITIYKLHEVIHNMCKIMYKKADKDTVRNFIRERVLPRQKQFIDPFWLEMESSKKDLRQLRTSNRKIDESIQRLFKMNADGSEQLKSFQSVFQTLWSFNIFPNFMAKSKIKYYYEYSSLQSSGLSLAEFTELVIGICLYMKKGLAVKASQKVKQVFQQFNYFQSKTNN